MAYCKNMMENFAYKSFSNGYQYFNPIRRSSSVGNFELQF